MTPTPSAHLTWAPHIRTVRVVVIAIGAAAVVFVALAIPAIERQAPLLQPWFLVLALTVTPLLPAALGMVAFGLCAHKMKIMAGSIALGYLVVLAAWMPAMTVAALPEGSSPWVLGYLGIPTAAAALAWSARVAWAYLAVASVGLGLLRFFASGQTDVVGVLHDTLYAILYSSIVATLAIALLKASERLDEAAVAARAETANAAAAEAREQQRARVDGLMHDSVFTTLLVAARSTPPTPALVAHARATLHQLDQLKAEEDSSWKVAGAQFAAMQTAAIRAVAPDASITVEINTPAAVRGDAALALGEALSEALRNSVFHAPTAKRAVHLRATGIGIRIRVEDDGPGFEPTAVPANRLGIGVSIIERMRAVPGGDASVRSAPGHGTVIALRWVAQ